MEARGGVIKMEAAAFFQSQSGNENEREEDEERSKRTLIT